MASQEESKESVQNKESEGESWWQSWGKSFVDTVKEKTSHTVELVQRDLSEFYQTIQSDTAHIVVDTATKVQHKIQTSQDDEDSATASFKQGFSSILSSVSQSLKTLTKDEDSHTADEVDDFHSSSVYNRKEMKILAIQKDVGTYCNEPEGTTEEFNSWQEEFDFDSKRAEMSDLLVKNQEIRALYSRLVPTVVSHNTFWRRYFYKLHLFEMEEERRAALVARADVNSLHEENYKWDSDDGEDILDDEPFAPSSGTNEAKMDINDTENEEADRPMTTNDQYPSNNDSELPSSVEKLSVDPKPVIEKREDDLAALAELSCTQNDDASNLKEHSSKETPGLIGETESHVVVESETIINETDATTRDYQRTMSDNDKDNESSSSSSVEVIHVISGVDSSPDHPKEQIDRKLGKITECSQSGSDDKRKAKSTDGTNVLVTSGAHDKSETSSTGSWISVDDEIRVRRSRKEKIADPKDDAERSKATESNRNSGSSSSSAVLVEKDECKKSDNDENGDEDVDDFDLDEDINEEELQKIMEKIKDKSGDLDDDDDWEDWE